MYRLHLNPTYCKGCGICIDTCPKHVIESTRCLDAKGHMLPKEGNMIRCSGCRICELVCPDFAIAIEEDEPAEEENDVRKK